MGKLILLTFVLQFFMCQSNSNVHFDSNGLLSFYIYLREISTYNLKKQKHLLGKIFDSCHISNRIYLLRNCSSNYVYLKNRYITLAGIGKIMFVSVFRILLICKSLNLQPPSLKKLNFPMLQYLYTIFRVRKLISV